MWVGSGVDEFDVGVSHGEGEASQCFWSPTI